MKKVYLDTNVYIFGLTKKQTNSHSILQITSMGTFTVITSYYLLEEIKRWFMLNRGKDAASKVIYFINRIPNETFVEFSEIEKIKEKYKKIINKKDLPHLSAAIFSKSDYFVTSNRHFLQLKFKDEINFITPKEFCEKVLKIREIFDSAW